MTQLCMNTMNRSAFFLAGEDPDLEGQIEAAAAAGFDGIGPDTFTLKDYVERGGSVERVAEKIAACGLEVLELPTLMIEADPEQTRREANEVLALAQVLRPGFVQVNIGSAIDQSVVDEFKRAGEHFLAVGARLAIEYLPWLPEIKDIQSTRAFLDRAGLEGAGVLVDSWHFTHSSDTWEDLEALPLAELAYVQFDDHPAFVGEDIIDETVNRRVMPGEGTFELERFARLIRDKGFDGMVSCEVLSTETRRMDLGAFARRVYSTTRPYWLD